MKKNLHRIVYFKVPFISSLTWIFLFLFQCQYYWKMHANNVLLHDTISFLVKLRACTTSGKSNFRVLLWHKTIFCIFSFFFLVGIFMIFMRLKSSVDIFFYLFNLFSFSFSRYLNDKKIAQTRQQEYYFNFIIH